MPTKISWTDETINPIVGCSRISAGCQNCYAAEVAKSPRLQQFPQYQKVGKWDGTVEFVESQLLKPLGWRSPKRIFVGSMSDLFHSSIPDEWRDKIFAVMAIAPWHTYQILTKRPERMLEYFTAESAERVYRLAHKLLKDGVGGIDKHSLLTLKWPLANVWLGVSVENQKAADSRIPLLLQTPAKVRFLSCEPLLEAIDLSEWLGEYIGEGICDACGDEGIIYAVNSAPLVGGAICTQCCTRLNWVISGGESGAKDKVRVCHIDWLRSLIRQSKTANIPIFIKQLGTAATDGHTTQHYLQLKDRKGGDLNEFPEDLRVREFPKITE